MTRRIFALLAALGAFGATGAHASPYIQPEVVWISPPPLVEVAPRAWSRVGIAPEAWLATSRYRPVIYNHAPEFVVYPIAASTERRLVVRHHRRLSRRPRRGCR